MSFKHLNIMVTTPHYVLVCFGILNGSMNQGAGQRELSVQLTALSPTIPNQAELVSSYVKGVKQWSLLVVL